MQQQVSEVFLKLMEAYGVVVKQELSTMAPQYWKKEFGPHNGITNKKKRVCGKFKKFRCGEG